MKNFLLALCFGLIMASNALAQVRINGTAMPLTDNCYTVPETTSVESVEIESGSTLIIPNGVALTVTGIVRSPAVTCLIIEEGGQLINGDGANGSAEVNATVKKHIEAFNMDTQSGWYTLSSPLSSSSITATDVVNLIPSNNSDFDLYRYRENNNNNKEWQRYGGAFKKIDIGRGYLYASKVGADVEFKGELSFLNEVQTATNSVTYANPNANIQGFNLIGNPFPHSIYMGKHGSNQCGIANENIVMDGYYTITNNGHWEPQTNDVAIQPCQGILIKLKTALLNNQILINKTTLAPMSSKGIGNHPLYISVKGLENDEDKAYLYMRDGDGLDKIEHFSETAPNLSILYNNKKYAIACVEEYCNMVDVLFKNSQSGFYTINIDNSKINLQYLHLVDNLTGEDIDMLKEKSYKFYAFGNEGDNRFKLILNSNANSTDASTFAYVSDGDIIVTGLDGNATMQIYDIMGRLVNTEMVVGTSGMICRVHKPAASGVYVLRLLSSNGVQNQKIVIE